MMNEKLLINNLNINSAAKLDHFSENDYKKCCNE